MITVGYMFASYVIGLMSMPAPVYQAECAD